MPTFEFNDGTTMDSADLGPINPDSVTFNDDGVNFTWSISPVSFSQAEYQPAIMGGRLTGVNTSAPGDTWELGLTGTVQNFSGNVVLNITSLVGSVNLTFVGAGTQADVNQVLNATGTWSATGTFSAIRFTSFNGFTASRFALNDITTNITCFVAGTRIATPEGFALVEDLAEGDVVSTPEGKTTVRWVGRRVVDPRLVRPELVNPVRIAAGALGNERDLLVSPDHAVLVDGMLVNASALVDGDQIRRVARAEPFTYYHVETDAHELILAEGVPCESYLPEREEFSFDNEATRPAREIAEMDLPRITSARLAPKREAA